MADNGSQFLIPYSVGLSVKRVGHLRKHARALPKYLGGPGAGCLEIRRFSGMALLTYASENMRNLDTLTSVIKRLQTAHLLLQETALPSMENHGPSANEAAGATESCGPYVLTGPHHGLATGCQLGATISRHLACRPCPFRRVK